MKRYCTTALLASMLIIGGRAVYAAPVDLSIGGTAWYAWWKPAWADAKTMSNIYVSTPALFTEDAHDFKASSNVIGGPIIAIGFLDRWSIQSVFTIGRFMAQSSGLSTDVRIMPSNPEIAFSYKKYTRDIIKWDSDTSIGCEVHKLVKVYAGFKSQGYRYKETMKDSLVTEETIFNRKLTDEVRAYGGGLGFQVAIPIIDKFYIVAGASGIVLWSKEIISIDRSHSYVMSYSDPFFPMPILDPKKGRYFSYGGAVSLSFTYNFERINTAISLGGRYQLLFNRQSYSRHNLLYNDVSMNIIDKNYDHFFGITLSAIYTFHIGEKA